VRVKGDRETGLSVARQDGSMSASSDFELIAQQVNAAAVRIRTLEKRLAELDRVVGRLEGAALTTARSLQQISHHWDAVYEAMQRVDDATSFDLSSDDRESSHAEES
jgi:uncharacterized coiled-coil protein SlyX